MRQVTGDRELVAKLGLSGSTASTASNVLCALFTFTSLLLVVF